MDVIPARIVANEPLTLATAPDAVYDITARLGQWYRARALDLPLETQAEFARMAFEALVRNPERAAGEVLDELIAELDDMLEDIVAEPHAVPPVNRRETQDDGATSNWLQRLIRRRR